MSDRERDGANVTSHLGGLGNAGVVQKSDVAASSPLLNGKVGNVNMPRSFRGSLVVDHFNGGLIVAV